ncbi:MAG: hypothetical protein ACRCX2_28790 [Paraclostridium sp.]
MDLKSEKILACSEIGNDISERYNMDSEKLKEMNDAMANISSSEKSVKKGTIVTAVRTAKDYNELWSYFKKRHLNEFESYMGYGLSQIERIGYKKFIDFIDWRTKRDVDKWKEDRIKTIPCRHCKSEFTTFQIDFGLCDKCKGSYDMKRFEEVCQAVEDQNPGSASAYIMMFTYIDEFREMYKKVNFGASLVEDMIKIDSLSDMFTYSILRDHVIGSESNIEQFLSTCNRIYQQHPEYTGEQRYKSLKTILESDDSNEAKLERIRTIYVK